MSYTLNVLAKGGVHPGGQFEQHQASSLDRTLMYSDVHLYKWQPKPTSWKQRDVRVLEQIGELNFSLLQLQSSVERIIHTIQLHIHTLKHGHKHKMHVCTCRHTCTTGHVLGWVVFGCSSWLDRGPVFERSKLKPVFLIWEVSLSLKRHWRHHK